MTGIVRLEVRAFDRYRCRGCGQLLTFDAEATVPAEQLRACESRCDWVLVGRGGPAVSAAARGGAGRVAPVAHVSEPSLVVLHHLTLKGIAETAALLPGTGLPEAEVRTVLEALQAHALVVRGEGRIPGWTLTPAGRDEHRVVLRADVEASGRRADVQAAYRAFLELNAGLLRICTDWQVRDLETNERNDHLDTEYDAAVRARLQATHEAVVPICGELTTGLTRFATYHGRFDVALENVHQGRNDWFARPVLDSYHTVWMELHEDLLSTLQIDRHSESVPG